MSDEYIASYSIDDGNELDGTSDVGSADTITLVAPTTNSYSHHYRTGYTVTTTTRGVNVTGSVDWAFYQAAHHLGTYVDFDESLFSRDEINDAYYLEFDLGDTPIYGEDQSTSSAEFDSWCYLPTEIATPDDTYKVRFKHSNKWAWYGFLEYKYLCGGGRYAMDYNYYYFISNIEFECTATDITDGDGIMPFKFFQIDNEGEGTQYRVIVEGCAFIGYEAPFYFKCHEPDPETSLVPTRYIPEFWFQHCLIVGRGTPGLSTYAGQYLDILVTCDLYETLDAGRGLMFSSCTELTREARSSINWEPDNILFAFADASGGTAYTSSTPSSLVSTTTSTYASGVVDYATRDFRVFPDWSEHGTAPYDSYNYFGRQTFANVSPKGCFSDDLDDPMHVVLLSMDETKWGTLLYAQAHATVNDTITFADRLFTDGLAVFDFSDVTTMPTRSGAIPNYYVEPDKRVRLVRLLNETSPGSVYFPALGTDQAVSGLEREIVINNMEFYGWEPCSPVNSAAIAILCNPGEVRFNRCKFFFDLSRQWDEDNLAAFFASGANTESTEIWLNMCILDAKWVTSSGYTLCLCGSAYSSRNRPNVYFNFCTDMCGAHCNYKVLANEYTYTWSVNGATHPDACPFIDDDDYHVGHTHTCAHPTGTFPSSGPYYDYDCDKYYPVFAPLGAYAYPTTETPLQVYYREDELFDDFALDDGTMASVVYPGTFNYALVHCTTTDKDITFAPRLKGGDGNIVYNHKRAFLNNNICPTFDQDYRITFNATVESELFANAFDVAGTWRNLSFTGLFGQNNTKPWIANITDRGMMFLISCLVKPTMTRNSCSQGYAFKLNYQLWLYSSIIDWVPYQDKSYAFADTNHVRDRIYFNHCTSLFLERSNYASACYGPAVIDYEESNIYGTFANPLSQHLVDPDDGDYRVKTSTPLWNTGSAGNYLSFDGHQWTEPCPCGAMYETVKYLVVFNTSDDGDTAGTFRYILTNVAEEGDVITFDDSLFTDGACTLTHASAYPTMAYKVDVTVANGKKLTFTPSDTNVRYLPTLGASGTADCTYRNCIWSGYDFNPGTSVYQGALFSFYNGTVTLNRCGLFSNIQRTSNGLISVLSSSGKKPVISMLSCIAYGNTVPGNDDSAVVTIRSTATDVPQFIGNTFVNNYNADSTTAYSVYSATGYKSNTDNIFEKYYFNPNAGTMETEGQFKDLEGGDLRPLSTSPYASGAIIKRTYYDGTACAVDSAIGAMPKYSDVTGCYLARVFGDYALLATYALDTPFLTLEETIPYYGA